MLKLILLASIALSGMVALRADEEAEVPALLPEAQPCADGEVWKTCVSGSCAETTCEQRVLPDACTEDCNYGCFCKDGYYRNAEKVCVTVDHCPEVPDTHHEEDGNHEKKTQE